MLKCLLNKYGTPNLNSIYLIKVQTVISHPKKIISELHANTANQVLLLRILGNKVQRLLKIKEQENKLNHLDDLINNSKYNSDLIEVIIVNTNTNNKKFLDDIINNYNCICVVTKRTKSTDV